MKRGDIAIFKFSTYEGQLIVPFIILNLENEVVTYMYLDNNRTYKGKIYALPNIEILG